MKAQNELNRADLANASSTEPVFAEPAVMQERPVAGADQSRLYAENLDDYGESLNNAVINTTIIKIRSKR